jgi:predicted AAA+ superfamily ATPase
MAYSVLNIHPLLFMKKNIREIILENQFNDIGVYHPRQMQWEIIPGKALVITGVRRAGKTTFLKEIADNLPNSEKHPGQIVYINFSDERLIPMKAANLGDLLEVHHEIFDLSEGQVVHWFLDEIQLIEGWELFVDRLIRSKNRRVYLSGSSSKLLSKEIASAMRGRAYTIEMFPFSFKEILDWEKIPRKNIAGALRGKIVSRFKRFLKEGGFPEVVPLGRVARRTILQNYYQVMILRDIVERHNPFNTRALIHVLKLLINQAGSSFTINKLEGKCKTLGIHADKKDISRYLDWFHDCYLLHYVPIFSESINKQTVNPRKVYCIDNGLLTAVSSGILERSGNMLENLVFCHLRRHNEKIFYFKDQLQREVDFVVQDSKDKTSLIQVCESLADEKTKEREIAAMKSAMSSLGKRKGMILTLEESEIIKVPEGEIEVLPVWEFLLQ